jgi:hypothetical protein
VKYENEICEVILLSKAVRLEFFNADKSRLFIARYSPALDSIEEAFATGASSASVTMIYEDAEKAKIAYTNIVDRLESYLS